MRHGLRRAGDNERKGKETALSRALKPLLTAVELVGGGGMHGS